MTFNTSIYGQADLRIDLSHLVAECQRAARMACRQKRTGYTRGQAEALYLVAGWVQQIERRTRGSLDLATAITDLIACLQRNERDERSDAQPVRVRPRKRSHSCEQKRLRAYGKAHTYAETKDLLSSLLQIYYPNRAFPLTLSGGTERTRQCFPPRACH